MFFNFGCCHHRCRCERPTWDNCRCEQNWNCNQNWNNCNQNWNNQGWDNNRCCERKRDDDKQNWRGNCQCFPIPFIICCDDNNNNHCCR